PNVSMNASTFPPEACRIGSAMPFPYSTGTTPRAVSQAWFGLLASPITVAPRRRASCTASDPTPPAAPEMTTVSAGPGSTANTVAYAVVPATYNDPATSQGSPAGREVSATSSTTTNSAWLALLRVKPRTSSPTAKPRTREPASTTTPARSLPCPEGNVAGHRSCSSPVRIWTSPGWIPAARTSTSTCAGPGTGRGTSSTCSTSIPPYSWNRTALTA